MFTVTDPDGTHVTATSDMGAARLAADARGVGSAVVDEAGICIYIATLAYLAGDDTFSE